MRGLSGKNAIVTGAGGAIGSAIAERLSEAGCVVGVLDRDRENAERVAQKLGKNARALVVDITDHAAVVKAVGEFENAAGPTDVLVNAAGGNRPEATLPPGSDFCQLPLDAWQAVFDLNLVGGVLLPCQVFGQQLLNAGRGSVINIASMAGMIPLSRVVAYSAAKAAVINLTRFLAREWAQRGVRVNSISPGFFPAEQNRALLFDPQGRYTERGQQIINHTPMARFGDPRELAGAAVWLAAHHASSFVTGQNIVVDGGFSAVTI